MTSNLLFIKHVVFRNGMDIQDSVSTNEAVNFSHCSIDIKDTKFDAKVEEVTNVHNVQCIAYFIMQCIFRLSKSVGRTHYYKMDWYYIIYLVSTMPIKMLKKKYRNILKQ